MALALLVAGVLGGGAFGFAAGLATGYQMSPVAYRGDLPPPQRDPAVAATSSAPGAASRETPTAETAQAAPEAARTVSAAAAVADAIPVALPERTRWHGGWRQDSGTGTLSYQDIPPPPPSKPRAVRTQTASLQPAQGSAGSAIAVSLAPRDWPPAASATPASLSPQDIPPRPPQAPERTPPRDAAAPPPVPADTGPRAAPAHGRYSVQIGAFRDRDNAVELAAEMSDQGYPVRIVHEQATRSRLYMVRLGAFADRPAALAYATQVARAEGVDTWPVHN